jgi:hypothetical protein
MISLATLRDGWNRFFFATVSALPVAAFRAVFGLVTLIDGLVLWPYRLAWFGETGVLPYATARAYTGGLRLDLFAVWPRGDTGVTLFLLLHLLAALFLMLGLFSRVSAAVVFATLVTLHHRNTLILNSGDTMLRLFSFFLILAPCGAALSLDRWWKQRRSAQPLPTPTMTAWPLRLMQIQFSLIYIASVSWKLEGASWLDGTALYYTTRLVSFHRFPVPFFFNQLWFLRLGTWASLVIEAGLGIGIWIKELRYPCLIAGLLLHLGIDYTMNIPLFEWISMSLFMLFVDGDLVRRAAQRFSPRLAALV